jgi:hypothetical protein
VQLFKFFVQVGGRRRVADVGIDLTFGVDADGHRFQCCMVDVGWNNHAATRDFIANELRCQTFARCDVAHFFGDFALAGQVHLRIIAVAVLQATFDPSSSHQDSLTENSALDYSKTDLCSDCAVHCPTDELN